MNDTNRAPDSYLESGTNELKILEFSTAGLHFGLNILKTSRILDVPERLTRAVNAHPAVKGVMVDHGKTLPVVDLALFLGLRSETEETLSGRILVTEFFSQVNGFLIDTVHYVHTILWKRVFDAHDILGNLGSQYVIGIVRPDDKTNILLLDYEKIVFELSPGLAQKECQKIPDDLKGDSRVVLVAEDSPAVRDMLAVELSDMGFELLTAKDGLEALTLFEKHPDIALVVCDVEMPQLEGLSLTKQIKEARPDLPVIVYSSIGDIGMKERARKVGADAHVTKLNIDELMAHVRRLMEIGS